MRLKTSIYALLALALGAVPVAAEGVRTGLADLTIVDPDGDRHIQGYLWFPTDQTKGQVRAHGNVVWEPITVIPNAVPTSGQHPLVLLSHGMFGNARNQAWLAQSLTQKGYIVAAIDHPGTSTFQRDPDHRRQLWERANDITRTLDHILDSDTFADLVDRDRIFMAGHSLGGFTAVLLAGGRFDVTNMRAFCGEHSSDIACGVFDAWNVAKTPEDQEMFARDWSDARLAGFAVLDLGGTQMFSGESLAKIERPMLVIGAPLDIHGMDLDVESRALVAALPKDGVTYLEPENLSHFDFLGVCTAQALDLLRKEEPDDVFVCQQGIKERRHDHGEIAQTVAAFFSGL